ncbi:MAG: glycosyltransferase family 4 protein [Gemmatimonadota bacterium]
MRIALVTEFYYPHLGGVTEHVHNLALTFRRLGHEVIVVTSDMGDATHDGPFVRRIGTSRIIYSSGSFARVTTGRRLRSRLEDLFRNERIDIVHTHGPLAPTLGLAAPAAAHRLGIPVVGTFHSWFPSSALYRIFQRPLQRRLDRYAAAIAVSEPVIAAHSRYFQTEWHVIPNGIDTDVFRPCERPAGEGPRLLFLGRLDPRNGLDTVIKAMPRILAEQPDARLIVAGDGPLRNVYERLARPVADHVEFVGYVNGDRPERYGTADLYLCPTTKASFGITLLESMACGTPMVVSDIIGFRELVDGGAEAVLAPKGEPEAWAKAALELIPDVGRRIRMGAAGREKSLRFAWPVVAGRVLDVYQSVIR